MRAILIIAIITVFMSAADAQTRRRSKTVAKKPSATQTAPVTQPLPAPEVAKPEPKKNERPATGETRVKADVAPASNGTTYRYEFAQPEFEISKIVIEHDDTGRGTIRFTKRMLGETENDPMQVSPAALGRINAALTALNFIDSRDSYQFEKDYSHLGTMTFGFTKEGKQRTASFNYTTNKDARALADEYRKLSNQFVWIFEITVSRENQPLESPRLLDSLDSLIRRNEISDPEQMIALLKDLSNDERIPLIARNHATRLVQKIEKSKKGN
jgi:hypothetical protein